MAYVALYRKWRPGDFENLVGQDHISRTLANAIKTGKIAHAYLFSGPRGTGKTSTAKILAKALNCENGPTPSPCNQCASCTKINVGSSMDVFEIDAASNRGIDEIRDLRETVKFTPVDGRYKVYIIDEVHMLTTEAFNALLKTLEEPPAHVVFILATTEAHKVPATIHSRCQRYDFKRIAVLEIVKRLELVASEMKRQVEEDALRLIAIHADGGMRDALGILDQCSALDDACISVEKVRKLLGLVGHEWIWKIVDFVAAKDMRGILQSLDELISKGKDVKQILAEIALHMRSVLIYQAAGDATGVEMYSTEKEVLASHSEKFTREAIVRTIQKMHAALMEAKWSPQPRITTEVALLSLCDEPAEALGNDSMLLRRLEELEGKIAALGKGAMVSQPAPRSALREALPQRQVHSAAARSAAPLREMPATNPDVPRAAVLTTDAGAVWDRLLKTLVDTGKRSIYACVSQGQFRGLNGNQLHIAFMAAFPKERTEKTDYREMLETILREICGQDIKVHCTLENVAPPPAPKPVVPKKPTVEIAADLTPAAKQVMDKTMEIFGDNFVSDDTIKK